MLNKYNTIQYNTKYSSIHNQSTAINTQNSSKHTAQQYTHNTAVHTQYSNTHTEQQYTHSTAVHTQYSNTHTVQQYTHSTAIHTQYSSTHTVQQYTHSTAVHTQYSSTHTIQQYTHNTTCHNTFIISPSLRESQRPSLFPVISPFRDVIFTSAVPHSFKSRISTLKSLVWASKNFTIGLAAVSGAQSLRVCAL